MNPARFILLLLLAGCAMNPQPALLTRQSSAQPETTIAPPALDPPPGVTIPIPPALQQYPTADFFTAANLNGPWTYRTDDLRIATNADGTTSGYFTNTPPGAPQEFYLIVPVGSFPLPPNIITNS